MTDLVYRLKLNPHLITVCQAQDSWERRFGISSMRVNVEVDTTGAGHYFIARMSFASASDAMLFKLEFSAPVDSPIYEHAPQLL